MSFYDKLEEHEQLFGLNEENMLELDRLMNRYLSESANYSHKHRKQSLEYLTNIMIKLLNKAYYQGIVIKNTKNIKLFQNKNKVTSNVIKYDSTDQDQIVEQILKDMIYRFVNTNYHLVQKASKSVRNV